MKFVFNAIYLVMLFALTPWVVWRMVVQGKNRRGWRQKLLGLAPKRESDCPCIWIHAVSVGEINLLGPFLAQVRQQFPRFEIAISTSTETGFDLAKKKYSDTLVFFCPSDFSWAINNTIKRIRPGMLLLTELELWPNLISVTKSQGIPVALINGRISQKSFEGYRRWKFLWQPILNKLDVGCVQTEAYADRLKQLGMVTGRVQVCGNIKYDCVEVNEDSNRARELSELAGIDDGEFVFLAGSTQENEDLLALDAYQRLLSSRYEVRLVLVPRHPQRCGRLAKLLTERDVPFILRSQFEGGLQTTKGRECVIVVDMIGELADWWRRANAGYVGGSMGQRGGQNMIEPASCGVPICFGPNTENFKDVVELLITEQAAQVVRSQDELYAFLERTLSDRQSATSMGRRARQTVSSQRGATLRTLAKLEPWLQAMHPPDSDCDKQMQAA